MCVKNGHDLDTSIVKGCIGEAGSLQKFNVPGQLKNNKQGTKHAIYKRLENGKFLYPVQIGVANIDNIFIGCFRKPFQHSTMMNEWI